MDAAVFRMYAESLPDLRPMAVKVDTLVSRKAMFDDGNTAVQIWMDASVRELSSPLCVFSALSRWDSLSSGAGRSNLLT